MGKLFISGGGRLLIDEFGRVKLQANPGDPCCCHECPAASIRWATGSYIRFGTSNAWWRREYTKEGTFWNTQTHRYAGALPGETKIEFVSPDVQCQESSIGLGAVTGTSSAFTIGAGFVEGHEEFSASFRNYAASDTNVSADQDHDGILKVGVTTNSVAQVRLSLSSPFQEFVCGPGEINKPFSFGPSSGLTFWRKPGESDIILTFTITHI